MESSETTKIVESSASSRLSALKETIESAKWEKKGESYTEDIATLTLLPLNEADICQRLLAGIPTTGVEKKETIEGKLFQKALVHPIMQTRKEIADLLSASPSSQDALIIQRYSDLNALAKDIPNMSEKTYSSWINSLSEISSSAPILGQMEQKLTIAGALSRGNFQKIVQQKGISLPNDMATMDMLALQNTILPQDAEKIKVFLGISGSTEKSPIGMLLRQREEKKMTESEREAYGGHLLAFSTLLLSKLLTSGMIEAPQVEAYLKNIPLGKNFTLENATEKIEGSHNEFSLPSVARGQVDAMKTNLLVRGGEVDTRLAPLMEYLRTGKVETPDRVLEIQQLIADITAEGENIRFSPKNLEKIAREIGKADATKGREQATAGEEETGLSAKGMSKFQNELLHIALYELAIDAQKKLETDFKKIPEQYKKNLMEGSGFQILPQGKMILGANGKMANKEDFDYSNAGNFAKQLTSFEGLPAGIATMSGIMMFLMNILVFIRKPNSTSLAYAMAGLGISHGGVTMLQKKTIDSALHPENMVFNKLQSLSGSEEQKYWNLYGKYEDFFSCIDFGERGSGAFRQALTRTKKQHNKQESQKQNGNQQTRTPDDKLNEVGIEEFLEVFSGIFRGDGAKNRVASGSASSPLGQRYDEKYKESAPISMSDMINALQWIYYNNIPNDRIHEMSLVSRDLEKRSVRILAKTTVNPQLNNPQTPLV
ncbi:hypothetical protein IPN35_05545 [Candidatus Peregrinibacteria bacterium]|nr:MAG: hypothetical protein IPN35_05545 [Candidatus Peregrinibacteria bacterium]